MSDGRLITIEGIDGAGKSTVAAGLESAIAQRGRDTRLLREPGGVAVAEQIRTLVVDPQATIGARTEALLYAAARAQLVEEAILPLLDQGVLVLLDRFVDSSLAYQGAGRGLGIAEVRAINLFATAGVAPDRTLLLRLDPQLARERARERGDAQDRLEGQPDEFFALIAAGYDHLARAEPERIRPVDASQAPAAVLADALDAIADLI
jgi:dTMP kinase